MKLRLMIFTFALLLSSVWSSNNLSAQVFGVNTNFLGLATGTINVGFDFKVANHWSIEVPIYINPIVSDKFSLLSASIQPALKYWFYNVFVGHYIALSNLSSYYQISTRSDSIDKGWLTGGGLSYGYSFILSRSWSMNVEVGFGAYYAKYDNYKRYLDHTEDKYVYARSNILLLPARTMWGVTYHF